MNNKYSKLSNTASFLDIAHSEMLNSLSVAESLLNTFRKGRRCYWALSGNINLIVEFHLITTLTKRIYEQTLEDDTTRALYNGFRNRCVSLLDNYSTLSSSEHASAKHDVFTLLDCPPTIKTLFKQVFTVSESSWGYTDDTLSELNIYYNDIDPPIERTKVTITDFRQLLRIIVRVQNCLVFIYPKNIKRLRSHNLSNMKNILAKSTDTILSLPASHTPTFVATDGRGYDLYIDNKKLNIKDWLSTINGETAIGSGELRVYGITIHKGLIRYNEIRSRSRVRKLTFNAPKHSSYKECELSLQIDAEAKEETNKSIDDKLREMFAKLG